MKNRSIPQLCFSYRLRLVSIMVFMFLMAGCASSADIEQRQATERENTHKQDEEMPAPYAEEHGTPDVVSYENYADPLGWLNRPIFAFNDVSYRYALSPLAKGYQKVVPKPVNTGISNFFSNLKEPLNLLNHGLQGQPKKSGTNLARFLLNSTVGLLGFFDVSEHWWNLEKDATGFSETLASWGVGYGAYLVLPLIGPSDLRDGGGMLVDRFAHPVHYVEDETTKNSLIIFDGFQTRAAMLAHYPDIVNEVDEPYIFIRNFYLQNIQRDAEFEIEKAFTEEKSSAKTSAEKTPAK